MKLQAILSDIHSNLEALVAVLEAAERAGATSYVCLGDVVGYGADPVEAIRLVEEHDCVTVLGNHDRAAIEPGAEMGMNDWAREATLWTREHLGDHGARYLSALPLTAELDVAVLVHATPATPERWGYIIGEGDAASAFPHFVGPLCLVGHTHSPAFFEETNGGARFVGDGTLELVEGRRYIVNVGSVGQPRDGDPRAAFALLDGEEGTIRVVRVDYDVETARQKIMEAGLPRQLGDRLRDGH